VCPRKCDMCAAIARNASELHTKHQNTYKSSINPCKTC
jgi:hypothetical protein